MNTKFVGMKEFRGNIAEYARKARVDKTRFIVVSHKKPLFEVTPFSEDTDLDSLYTSITQAKKDVAEGRVYSHAQMVKMLS